MKRGFNNKFKTRFSLVKVEDLAEFDAGERITPDLLYQRGILSTRKFPVKVLGNGEMGQALTVAAHKFTRSARAKIEAAGGTTEEL